MRELSPDESAQLVDEVWVALCAREADCQRFETHISVVLLAGGYAYKFKKPHDYGFLDFSTLEKRRYFCVREVALNRRYAPELYLDVLALRRAAGGAVAFGDTGEVLDYVVHMRRFPAGARLDEFVARGELTAELAKQLGVCIAELHSAAPLAPAATDFGNTSVLAGHMLHGVDTLAAHLPEYAESLTQYRTRVVSALDACAARRAQGFVRDCHGDLHLSNVARIAEHWMPFDCIEFDDALRFIDTLNDFAFLKMDLDLYAGPALAQIVLNSYLATTGDYAGLSLLDIYCAYRTVVRAKVADLQCARDDFAAARRGRHLDLLVRYLHPTRKAELVITYGVAGSGKSWASERLAARHGHIHLRSDVERKRLAGLTAQANSRSPIGQGLYTPSQSTAVYAHLAALARTIIAAGYPVVVDATFLQKVQRDVFSTLARELNVPWRILACEASPEELRRRITARLKEGADPSEATLEVLARQLESREPLDHQELRAVITPD